ncbi:STAS domain-containing protein [Microbispora sp. ATCC PTA-5024]|uniref:STAS domain-containing protein n=1 Tax=Microbispora sp. ATCC PTA-5024 TaxID=316330 RepID=UPI0003DBDD15|nr:STAS domain-containing protein [Microbispora sp. ATCC PTA-5024]ETK37623.1 hypothetical protein MPTA5024_02680 [Microbispora sp. ATCC PTA-5024]
MPDTPLTVTTHPHEAGLVLLHVAGDLDFHTAGSFRRAIEDLPESPGPGVVIDLSGVTYCDSTGLTMLVRAYHHTRSSGTPLVLTGPDDNLTRMLSIVGLDRLFTVFDTQEAAVAALTA